MDISAPVSNWETELFSIKGIENRINYLEETIIKDLNDSYNGYLTKKMEYINENMHLEDSISDPGVMRLHTINERKIKNYNEWSKELEIQINRARNYLYSFYSWTENKHLLNEDKSEHIGNNTTLTIKERLIILQYLQDKIKIPGFSTSYKPWKLFISKFLDINYESLKKPLGKIEDSMKHEKPTESEATELIKSYEKITEMFQSVGLNDIKEIAEKRADNLRKLYKE